MVFARLNSGAGQTINQASEKGDLPFRFGPTIGGHPLSHWLVAAVAAMFAIDRL